MNSMVIFHSYVNVYQRVMLRSWNARDAFQKVTWLRLGVAVQVTVPSVMSFTDIESPIGTFEASVCDALETWWERWWISGSPWENLLNFKIWMIFDDFWCLESFHLDLFGSFGWSFWCLLTSWLESDRIETDIFIPWLPFGDFFVWTCWENPRSSGLSLHCPDQNWSIYGFTPTFQTHPTFKLA